MPQMLTRVRPNRPSNVPLHHASVAAARRNGVTDEPAKAGLAMTTPKARETTPAKAGAAVSAGTVQRVDIAHHDCDVSKEMQLLTSVQHCLSAIQSAKSSSRTTTTNRTVAKSVQRDAAQPADLPTKSITQNAPNQATSPAKENKPKHDSARVQIRLSKKLVRILAAFHRAGLKPGHVIERTMWRDARIQDAATILGLTVPVQQTSRKDKC